MTAFSKIYSRKEKVTGLHIEYSYSFYKQKKTLIIPIIFDSLFKLMYYSQVENIRPTKRVFFYIFL